MKITDSASVAIANVMKSKGLNIEKTFLEIGIFDGNLGMGFTREPMGKTIKCGELNVVIDGNVDTSGVVIDYGEINGKKGLIFLGEENVNNNN
jgi:hypothetical protein